MMITGMPAIEIATVKTAKPEVPNPAPAQQPTKTCRSFPKAQQPQP